MCFLRRDHHLSAENKHIVTDDYARHTHVQRWPRVENFLLKKILCKKYVLLAGLAANLAIPIAYISSITVVMRLWYEPLEAQHILVRLALAAAMPIAGASTAWAQNANGNLALSLGLVFFSTILSPIVTPVAFTIFGEMASEEFERVLQGLAAYGSGAFLGLWVVLPSLLGIAVRSIAIEGWLLEECHI